MFFAYRDFTGAADVILDELGLGRAHHRALHFIGRNPGMTVGDLLAILRITKQSLARVLTALVEQGYVAQAPGRDDRRQRLLTLTPCRAGAGAAAVRAAARAAGAGLSGRPAARAVEGFRRVMRGIMERAARAYIDRRGPARAARCDRGRPPPAHPPAVAPTGALGDGACPGGGRRRPAARRCCRATWPRTGSASPRAGNAAEAREQLRFVQPDLLVLDVMMPGETGLSLTETLRRPADPACRSCC